MSQNVSTKQIASEGSENYVANQQLSVDSYADRLMDELFHDVDRILEGGSPLPTQTVKADYVSLNSVTVPTIVLPPMTMSAPEPQKRADAHIVEANVVTDGKKAGYGLLFDKLLFGAACASLIVTLGLWLASRGEWPKQLAAAFAPKPAPTPAAAPEKVDPKTVADAKFAKYVQDALRNIDIQAKVSQQPTASRVDLPPTITISPLPLTLNFSDANSLAKALNRLAIALEKNSLPTQAISGLPTAKPTAKPSIAVPRITFPFANASPSQRVTPLPTATATAKVAPSPKVTAAPKVAPPPTVTAAPKVAVAPTVTAAPKVAPPPTATAAPKVTAAPTVTAAPKVAVAPTATAAPTLLPSPTAASSPTTSVSPTATASVAAQPKPAEPTPEYTAEAQPAQPTPEYTAEAQPAQPTPEYTASSPAAEPVPEYTAQAPVAESSSEVAIHKLVGVLELGDRSAALFEISGAVQRVNIGESIGSSGWSLVEISKGEAIIRRNGEVRSVYVQQKF